MRIDLSGTWRALPADDELRRSGTGPDADDSGWEPIAVPGHWRSTPAFADSDGPILHRRRFELDEPRAGERVWVTFDGVFHQADVWLDGAYLGDPEGYFAPHTFDVTDLVRIGREHVLAVEVACPPQRDRRKKRLVTGVFQHWDCLDPEWNPGGIWRPVALERTGPVRVQTMKVLCREADEQRASVAVVVELDSDAPRTVLLRTLHDGEVEREQEQRLAGGQNRVEWTFGIDDPRLWWPWALGRPELTSVAVEVLVDGVVSHAAERRTGLRRVSLDDWVLSVNGERLFCKGVNLGPSRMALGEAAPEELRRDVELAREAGLDLVRVHGHVSRPELYDAADELGMLVWQDFPLQWGYARSVRRPAVQLAGTMVAELGHHPSVVLWCGHNEPLTVDAPPGQPLPPKAVATFAAGQQLPSWNRTVLDRWVKRAIERADPTRPVIPHSGIAPHPPHLEGTDSHLYFGWYFGNERDLPGFAAAWPRMVRFVGEFGAQAVPESAGFCEPERWPDLDWERLGHRHNLQRWAFERHVPPGQHPTFASWQQATQEYQATVIRHHVETLRRLKYRPTGGFAAFLLADAHPAVTWSLLGHDRRAKRAWQALCEACEPVIVVADRMPDVVRPGAALALDVHVVSDLRQPLDGVEVRAVLRWPGDEHGWRFTGDLAADSCERVGTVRFVVPERPGDLVLDLELVADEVVASNRYTATIAG